MNLHNNNNISIWKSKKIDIETISKQALVHTSYKVTSDAG